MTSVVTVRGLVEAVALPVLSFLVLGGSCKAEVSRPRGRGCLRPTRILLLEADRRVSGGAEAAPPLGPAGRYATPASLPSLGRGCRGRNRRGVPRGGTWTRRTKVVQRLLLARCRWWLALAVWAAAVLVAALWLAGILALVVQGKLTAINILAGGTPLVTEVRPNVETSSASASISTEFVVSLVLLRSAGLVVDLAAPLFPAACGRPLGRKSTLRITCARMPLTFILPACERMLSATSIFYIVIVGGAALRMHLERSMRDTDFLGVLEIDARHGDLESAERGHHRSVVRRRSTKDADFQREAKSGGEHGDRMIATGGLFRTERRRSCRGARSTEEEETGRIGTRVKEVELGRRKMVERMNRELRRGTAWMRRRARVIRGDRDIYTIPFINTIIFTIVTNAVSFVDTLINQKSLVEPYEGLIVHLLIVTAGARAPGVAATS